MKTGLLLTIAVAASICAGCSNENDEMDNWNGEILLSSGITVQQTRATFDPNTQIADAQQIGVYVSKMDDETATYPGYANVSAIAGGDGTFSGYATSMFYPQSGKDVKIKAYHPYNSGTPDAYDFVVATDQSVAADYYQSDLLYAAEGQYVRAKTPHNLTFMHQLAKVSCTLITGSGGPSVTDATVTIMNVEKAISFNRITGVLSPPTIPVTADVELGVENGAIIAPQTVAKGSQLLRVTLSAAAGGGEMFYTLPDGVAPDLVFAFSSIYHFNITVNLTGLTVSSTINPWLPNAPINGPANMN